MRRPTAEAATVAMMRLEHAIGEAAVNSALRGLLAETRYRGAPWVTSAELLAQLRAVTPGDRQGLLTELFERVVVYDNRVLDQYTWERTAEKYLDALAGGDRDTDEAKHADQATAIASSDQRGAGELSEDGHRAVDRLPIPSYYTNPDADDITLETLDDLYYKLDLLAVGETVICTH